MIWSTEHAGLIVFLVDQSGSMNNNIIYGMRRSETNDYLMNVASYEASFMLNNQLFLCSEDRDCILNFVSLLIVEYFHCCVIPSDIADNFK